MKKKIRVLFLITDLGKGGAERFLIDLCNELNNRNDLDFLIGSLYDNNQYINDTANIKIVNLNYNTFSFTRKNDCLEYKRILKEFKPHIIHTHRFLAEFLSSYYVDRNIKYICHGHDNMIQLENFSFKTLFNKRLLLNFIEKQILVWKKYKEVDSFLISNSMDTYNYYKSVLPKNITNNVHLIECGINYNRFFNSVKKDVTRSKILKLINIGSFQDKKNQIFIIDIALELKKRGVLFEIHLLGDGENKIKVQKAIVENELDDLVFLHGNVNDVEHWLYNADIYVHTAWYEPFGLVLLEAMRQVCQ